MKPISLIAMALLIPTLGLAFHGQLKVNKNPKHRWALIFDLIEKNEIRYCLEIEDPIRFQPRSIELQVEAALALWEQPLMEIGLSQVRHLRVSCSERFDLRVFIGEERGSPHLKAYQQGKFDPFPHTFVSLNTKAFEPRDPAVKYIDFLSTVPSDRELESFLNEVSFLQPMDLTTLRERTGTGHYQMHWTTYPTLIHELGHSFGLCDTYEKGLVHCDPEFTQASHPRSVMQTADYLYLTEDDKLGITALYQRFKDSKK